MKNTSMKRKKAALYNPYLATMGGGERLILSILQVLDKNGYDITIFWDEDLTESIKTKLNLTFDHLRFEPNCFKNGSIANRLMTLSSFDILFYVPDGSYFFSTAKKNIIYAMVPDKKLYHQSFLNKLKLHNFSFITISEFSKTCLTQRGIQSDIIYPYLPEVFFNDPLVDKEKIILSVGRFFRHLHSKRQDVAIRWFKELIKSESRFAEYRLVLAGSVLPEDETYLAELKDLAEDSPQIEFKVNTSFQELLKLYSTAEYYWHFAGFGIDEHAHPEQTEHLGITPMEAMARGCVTCAYRAGGPKEIIRDGETGYLFLTQEELFEKMKQAPERNKVMVTAGIEYTKSQFSYNVFQKRVKEVILQEK